MAEKEIVKTEKTERLLSDTFILYCSWADIIDDLSDEEAGQLFKALFAYVNNSEMPDFRRGSGLAIAFKSIVKQIDVNLKKYTMRCETNRLNGAKGGRPKRATLTTDKTQKTERLFSKPNKTLNDNDNDNDNEYDYDNEEDNDVLLTENERNALVGLSSVESVEKYISKIIDWQKASGKRMKNPYMTIKGWIDEDVKSGNLPGETKKESNYDLDEFERYAMTSGFGGGKNKP